MMAHFFFLLCMLVLLCLYYPSCQQRQTSVLVKNRKTKKCSGHDGGWYRWLPDSNNKHDAIKKPFFIKSRTTTVIKCEMGENGTLSSWIR